MISDVSIQCFGDEWIEHMGIVLIALILYPIGVPALFFRILYLNRHRLDTRECKHRYAALFLPYKREFWYFESVEMSRKMILTGVMTLVDIDTNGESVPIFIALIVCLIFEAIQLGFAPFADGVKNMMQNISLTATSLTVAIGLQMHVMQLDQTTNQSAAQLYNAETSLIKSWMLDLVLIGSNMAVCVFFVYFMVVRFGAMMTIIARPRSVLLHHALTGYPVLSPDSLRKKQVKKDRYHLGLLPASMEEVWSIRDCVEGMLPTARLQVGSARNCDRVFLFLGNCDSGSWS